MGPKTPSVGPKTTPRPSKTPPRPFKSEAQILEFSYPNIEAKNSCFLFIETLKKMLISKPLATKIQHNLMLKQKRPICKNCAKTRCFCIVFKYRPMSMRHRNNMKGISKSIKILTKKTSNLGHLFLMFF